MLNQKDLWKSWVRDLAREQGRLDSLNPDDDDSPAPGLRGLRLGDRYELEGMVSVGGIGYVWRAQDRKLERSVAVKLLKRDLIQHASFRPRFAREARALASLSHPHIVAILDHGVEHGQPYLVMEYVEGPTVKALLDDKGPLEPAAAFRIAEQVLRALSYAHAHKVVHRDIKPANIVVQPVSKTSFHVKVLDFGFAKLLSPQPKDDADISDPGVSFGTPKYMSPEQLLRSSDAGPRADLYSLGVVLFEMLAGRAPFLGDLMEVARQHLAEPPPPLSAYCKTVQDASAADALLARALAKDPEARFQDADAFLDGLSELPEARSALPDAILVPSAFVPAATVELSLGDVELVPSQDLRSLLKVSEAPSEQPEPDAPRSAARGWALALGFGALVVVGLGVWAFTELSVDSPVPVGQASGEPAVEPVPPLPEPPPEGPPDLWSRPSESVLDQAHARLEAGERLAPGTVNGLLRYGQDHPDDPRPHLLLARLNVARNRPRQVLLRYALALRADPSAREDPHIRADLEALRDRPGYSSRARRLLAQLDELESSEGEP